MHPIKLKNEAIMVFEAIINENDNKKFGLAVDGHFAGEFKGKEDALKELKDLVEYEIAKLAPTPIEPISAEINDRNDVVIKGVEIDDEVFDDGSVGWRLVYLEDFIDDLIRWISQADRNSSDKGLMMEDLKTLLTWDDEYIWSSSETNAYVSPSLEVKKFNGICEQVLEANKATS